MRILLILLITLNFGVSLSAKLAPHTPAPRYHHLAEVNARWLYETGPGALLDTIAFSDEVLRIEAHLLAVHAVLANREVGSLTAKQRTRRRNALDLLQAYAIARRYPLNTNHPGRRPYFVDVEGTRCAVGHLMAELGAEATVATIAERTNYGYVLNELSDYTEVAAWGAQHGFTLEELAWIQPGYTGGVRWSIHPFGQGLGVEGGEVITGTHTHGQLLVAGSFTRFDGLDAPVLVRIAGHTVTPIANDFAAITQLLPLRTDSSRVLCIGWDAQQVTIGRLLDLDTDTFVRSWTFAPRSAIVARVSDSTQHVYLAERINTNPDRPNRILRLDPAVDGFVRLAPDVRLQGVIRDLYEFDGLLALGGSFHLLDSNRAAIDSNQVHLDLSAEAYLPDLNVASTRNNWPQRRPNAAILSFGQRFSGYYPLGGYGYFEAFALTFTPGLDSVVSTNISQRTNDIAALEESWPDLAYRLYGSPDDVLSWSWGNNAYTLSGPIDRTTRPPNLDDTTRLFDYSAPLLGYYYDQETPIEGRLAVAVQLGDPYFADSMLLAGTFTSFNGVPLRHLALVRQFISDTDAPAPPHARAYTVAGAFVLELDEQLPRSAELFLYASDGRLLVQRVLPQGQTTYRVPIDSSPLVLHFALRSEGSLRTGSVSGVGLR